MPNAHTVSRDGYTVLNDQFPAPLADALIADAANCDFKPPHPRAGGAFAKISLGCNGNAAHMASTWLTEAARREGVQGFIPNEASYQRYLPGGNGLPPHRDQRYYAQCIAIVTLQGTATFAVHSTVHREDVIDEWTTSPRQIILLRGWQYTTVGDPRPYHRIDPPNDGPRLMFQVRHNLAASTPPSPLLATLTDREIEQAASLAATHLHE